MIFMGLTKIQNCPKFYDINKSAFSFLGRQEISAKSRFLGFNFFMFFYMKWNDKSGLKMQKNKTKYYMNVKNGAYLSQSKLYLNPTVTNIFE